MEKIKLNVLTPEDAAEISFWEKKFNSNQMKEIEDFVVNSNKQDPFGSLQNLFENKLPKIDKKFTYQNQQYFILSFKNEAGEVIGFTAIELTNNDDFILNFEYVCVRPDKQGQGLAKEMIKQSNDFAEDQFQISHTPLKQKVDKLFETNFDKITAAIHHENEHSQKLFESLGFEIGLNWDLELIAVYLNPYPDFDSFAARENLKTEKTFE